MKKLEQFSREDWIQIGITALVPVVIVGLLSSDDFRVVLIIGVLLIIFYLRLRADQPVWTLRLKVWEATYIGLLPLVLLSVAWDVARSWNHTVGQRPWVMILIEELIAAALIGFPFGLVIKYLKKRYTPWDVDD